MDVSVAHASSANWVNAAQVAADGPRARRLPRALPPWRPGAVVLRQQLGAADLDLDHLTARITGRLAAARPSKPVRLVTGS